MAAPGFERPKGIEIRVDDDNGSDYTVINQGFSDSDEVGTSCVYSPKDGASVLGSSRTSPKMGNFKCSQCFKVIELGKPIYMRNDFPYCSKDCREMGVSSIYRVLFGSSLDNDAGFVTRIIRHIGGSVASISSVGSADDNEDYSTDASSIESRNVAIAARARAKSFLNSVIGTVKKTSVGSSFIRSYSNGVLWGKDITRNTSFNMLFSYLPEIHEHHPSSGNVSSPASSSSGGSSKPSLLAPQPSRDS